MKYLAADKGDVTIVEERDKYIQKIADKTDTGPYSKINRDPTKSREKKVNSTINDIMKDNHRYPNDVYDPDSKFLDRHFLHYLKRTDCYAPWLHGDTKIHKEGEPLREITDATESAGHDLAKALVPVLEPLVGKRRSHVRDGYHFMDQLNSGRFSKHKGNSILGSLDIKAMFPSIIMPEALSQLETRVLNDLTLADRTNLTAEELMQLVKVCVADPYFQCELGFFTN